MADKISYLVVEGPHDVEFVAKFLKRGGFGRVKQIDDLNHSFERLVPRSFPYNGDLLKRVPVPTFFQKNGHAVAVHSASGISNLVTVACDNLQVIGGAIHSFGFVLDQDDEGNATTRQAELIAALVAAGSTVCLPDNPGHVAVASGAPRTGAYILPDNVNDGALENLLIPAGKAAYADIFTHAENYLNSVDVTKLGENDLKYFQKPSGRNKALIASVGSILRPGKAIQVTLQDNLWITDDSIRSIAGLTQFADFLAELLEDPRLAP